MSIGLDRKGKMAGKAGKQTDDGMSKRALRKQENAKANDGGSSKMIYGIIIVVIICGAGAAQFISLLTSFAGGSDITWLDVTNEVAVNKALVSGEPHVIYCASDASEGRPLPQVVTDVKKKIDESKYGEGTQVMAANCFKKSEVFEGKTMAEKYNFGKNEGFIAVFVNGDKPLQLNYLQDAKFVAKQITPLLKVEVRKVVYLKDFEACQSATGCLVLGGKKKTMQNNMVDMFTPLLKVVRGLQVLTVDTSFYKVKLDEEFTNLRPEKNDEEAEKFGDGICLKNIKQEIDPEILKKETYVQKRKREQEGQKYNYYAKFLPSFEGDAPEKFMRECQAGVVSMKDPVAEAGWFKLAEMPTIKARSSDKPAKVITPEKNPHLEKARNKQDGTKKGKEYVGRGPAKGKEGAEGEEESIFGDDDESIFGEGEEGEDGEEGEEGEEEGAEEEIVEEEV